MWNVAGVSSVFEEVREVQKILFFFQEPQKILERKFTGPVSEGSNAILVPLQGRPPPLTTQKYYDKIPTFFQLLLIITTMKTSQQHPLSREWSPLEPIIPLWYIGTYIGKIIPFSTVRKISQLNN